MECKQQQLSGKLNSTPTDTSLVCRIGRDGLNKEETLSVRSVILPDNNLEENRSRHTGSSGLRVQNIVYVLNMRGEPLMPTTQQKSLKLLKQNEAKVVKRCPFTIQLKYATGETKQPLTLGIDSGYTKVGFSVTSSTEEIMAGELKLRTDIPKKLEERRMYRRGRRNKLWHRKPRFDNRTKPKGWLAPSLEHKVQTHIRLVDKIKSILPITKTTVEVANFDTQKMQNPEISGI